MVRLILLALLVSACAPKRDAKPQTIDPELAPYVANFVSEAKAHGRNVVVTSSVIFADLDGDKAGHCTGDHSTVLVSPRWWSQSTEERRQLLIYHELGHCALGRGHTTSLESYMRQVLGSFFPATRPTSIMYTTLPTTQDLYNDPSYKQRLTQELFR